MKNRIKLSIVTISLKNDCNLEKTLKSINEHFDFDLINNNVENLVIVSEKIKHIKDIKGRKYYYTPAKGVYNAMNKGLEKSLGNYIWFLNAGDLSYDNQQLIKSLEKINSDIIMAGVNSISPDGIINKDYGNYTSPHPGTIYKTSILKNIGGFREDFKVISDRVVFDELSALNASKFRLNKIIADFYQDGISSGQEGKLLNKKESLKYFLEKPYCFRRLYRYVKQF